MEKMVGPRWRVVTLRIERPLYYYLGAKAQELDMSVEEYIDRYFYSWVLVSLGKEVQQDV